MEVPLDYDHPDGEKIQIAISRTHSTTAHDPLGPLLVNPGGPGVPGLVHLPSFLASWMRPEVRDRFDLIGFDPRGIGESGQVVCYDPVLLSFRDDLPDLREPGAVEKARALYRRINKGCVDELGPRLTAFSTDQTARDMESIRLALGADTINCFGGSDGTFLGAVYAHFFPHSIRAMVLDSPIDLTESVVDFREHQVRAWEEVFDAFAEWAQQRSPELNNLRQRLIALFAKEKKDPHAFRSGDMISPLESYPSWPKLADTLTELLAGAPSPNSDDSEDERGRAMDLDDWSANRTIRCDDEAPNARLDDQAVARFVKEWPQKYPLFGARILNSSFPALLECTDWPAPPHPVFKGMIDHTGAPSILVVSGLHDPQTPHEGAAPFTTAVGGTLISTETPGHGQYLQQQKPDGCLNTAVDDYLLDLKLPPLGTTCPIDG